MECGLRCAGDVGRKAPLDGRGNGCCDVQGMLLIQSASPIGWHCSSCTNQNYRRPSRTMWNSRSKLTISEWDVLPCTYSFCTQSVSELTEMLSATRRNGPRQLSSCRIHTLGSRPIGILLTSHELTIFVHPLSVRICSYCTHIRSISSLDNLFLTTHIPRVFIPFVEYSNNGDSSVAIFTIMSLISHWPVTTASFQIRHEMCLVCFLTASWNYDR